MVRLRTWDSLMLHRSFLMVLPAYPLPSTLHRAHESFSFSLFTDTWILVMLSSFRGSRKVSVCGRMSGMDACCGTKWEPARKLQGPRAAPFSSKLLLKSSRSHSLMEFELILILPSTNLSLSFVNFSFSPSNKFPEAQGLVWPSSSLDWVVCPLAAVGCWRQP